MNETRKKNEVDNETQLSEVDVITKKKKKEVDNITQNNK